MKTRVGVPSGAKSGPGFPNPNPKQAAKRDAARQAAEAAKKAEEAVRRAKENESRDEASRAQPLVQGVE